MKENKSLDYEYISDALKFAFIYSIIILLSALFTGLLLMPRIHELEKSQTQLNETIDWIKENSESRNVPITFLKAECPYEFIKAHKIFDVDTIKTYCGFDGRYLIIADGEQVIPVIAVRNESEHFLTGTNISTERFFR